jgi:hypothetical protein
LSCGSRDSLGRNLRHLVYAKKRRRTGPVSAHFETDPRAVDIWRDTPAAVGAGVVIIQQILPTQQMIEGVCIKIAIIDLMPARTQSSQNSVCKAALKLVSRGWA